MAGEAWLVVEVSNGESLSVEVAGGGAGFFVRDSGTARWVLSLDKYATDFLVWDGAGCHVAEACREDSGGGVLFVVSVTVMSRVPEFRRFLL